MSGFSALWPILDPLLLKLRANIMKRKSGLLLLLCICAASGQRKEFERPAMHASRGTRGAIACGSEYAAEAGMRMYFHGGNAVDAGVATIYAAAITEFSHIGLG